MAKLLDGGWILGVIVRFFLFGFDLEKMQFQIQKDIYYRKKFNSRMRIREMQC